MIIVHFPLPVNRLQETFSLQSVSIAPQVLPKYSIS